jgi:hypothetical protein
MIEVKFTVYHVEELKLFREFLAQLEALRKEQQAEMDERVSQIGVPIPTEGSH